MTTTATTAVTAAAIAAALVLHSGKKGAVAAELGISARTLGRRLEQWQDEIASEIGKIAQARAAAAEPEVITEPGDGIDYSVGGGGDCEHPSVECEHDGCPCLCGGCTGAEDDGFEPEEAGAGGARADEDEGSPEPVAAAEPVGKKSWRDYRPAQQAGPAQPVKEAPAGFPAGVVTPTQFRHLLVREGLAPESVSIQQAYNWVRTKSFPVRYFAEDGTAFDGPQAGARPGVLADEARDWYLAREARAGRR